MAPATGIKAPLLPEGNEAGKSASVSGAVFNVATTVIGAGIMSIPATLKVLGVIPAFLLIVIIAVLAEISSGFLMRFTHSGETTTYAGVMKEAFGPVGSVATQVIVIFNNFGGLIMYLIVIGDVLSGDEIHLGILQKWFGIQWWNSREFALLVILIFIMLPLVLLRRVEFLRFTSAISTFLALVFVGVCSGLAIAAVVRGETETPRLFPRLDHQTSFFDLFTAIPVVVTAFSFHYNVHPIGFELSKPSDMTAAVRIALTLCASIYFSTGLFGYLLFGESTRPDILVNFDQTSGSTIGSLLNDLVRLSYALHIVLVFPLANFSLRANADELLFPSKPLLATDRLTRHTCLTLVLLFFSYLAAIAFPDIWLVFQFVGSTTAVCLSFIFPGAVALRDANSVSTRRNKIVAGGMIMLAVMTSVISISINIYDILSGKS